MKMLGLASVVLAATIATGASAQDAAEFYKGKTIRMIIGAAAGGGYDIPGRLMARHMGKHVPGNPAFVVENMPGAASLIMTNHLYNVAPRDGTVMGMPNNNIPLEPRLRVLTRGGGEARFDIEKMIWIGSPVQEPQLLWTVAKAASSVEDLRTREIVIGSMSVGADNYTLPMLANRLLGARMKMIPGYRGTADAFLAVERGELQGSGTSLANMMATKGEWFRDGTANVVLNFGLRRLPDLPDVPTAIELAEKQEDRELFSFIATKFAMARPLALPPEVPEYRVKALRAAFDAMMTDPDFVEDAKKTGLTLEPVSGEEIEKLIAEIQATPQEVVDRLRGLLLKTEQ